MTHDNVSTGADTTSSSAGPSRVPTPPPPETGRTDEVRETERSGSITGVGVVLGFSLGFMSQWSMRPGEWAAHGLFTLLVLSAGALLQLLALYRILRLPRATVSQHNTMIRLFMIGVCVILLGFALWVGFDLRDAARQSPSSAEE